MVDDGSDGRKLLSSTVVTVTTKRGGYLFHVVVVVVVRTTAYHGDIYYDAAGNATTMPHSAARATAPRSGTGCITQSS